MCSFRGSRPSLASRKISRPGRSLRLVLGLWGTLLLPVLLLPVASCGNSASGSAHVQGSAPSSFQLHSAAFREGSFIPARFTCQGANVSPPLAWMGSPAGVRSFALIVEDPDAPAGTWTHWVVFNLPAQTRTMQANMPKQGKLPKGGLQGTNSFGNLGYGGPCPPPGKPHRYFFRLYALDTVLSLQAGAGKTDVVAAMKDHVMGRARLMGRFKR